MNDKVDDPNMDPPSTGEVPEPLRRAIGERYLTYALSTIMHRALPDARDGLKPVHRRILYAMRELRLSPDGRFRKSSKISGDVMGNYHPHGDGAIYDAMARLAQDFNVRYPLVDGQGNFGNIDGDNPAASRYTEARLTVVAEALLRGLDEDAVDYRDNYDGTLTEPVVLPAEFPNLLANGAAGIAVGMATNIPPHNITELCDACLHLIKTPDARDDTLLNYIPGPDFPTGGTIVEPRESIAQAYRTGRGAFRLRCHYEIEDLGRGQWQIVVTEIPYQVQKSRLIEKLAELIQTKKIPILADVRDESADDVRVVLEPRSKNVDPDLLMGMLYRNSDLEIRFSLNMNVLIDGVTPKVCSLKEVLRAFLDHRQDVLQRRSRHRLGKIDKRLEVLEGFIIAFLNLDRVIEIIRYEDEPKAVMMEEFSLTDRQAEAILNMRLRSLRKLEEMQLRQEKDDLLKEQDELEKLLGSPARQRTRLKRDLNALRKEYGEDTALGARRTSIREAAPAVEFSMDAMIEKEPVTVILSQKGWIRGAKGHLPLDQDFKYKEGDGPAFVIHAQTTDKLLLATDKGRFFTIGADKLPGARGFGEPVRNTLDIDASAHIVALIVHKPKQRLLLVADTGKGFGTTTDELLAETRKGRQVVNLKGDAKMVVARTIEEGHDHVACVGDNRKLVVFNLEELPELARGQGVTLQRYRDGGLSDATTFTLAEGLSWTMGGKEGRTRTEGEMWQWKVARGGAGRMPPQGFPRDNKFT